jgi:hypothetical protein
VGRDAALLRPDPGGAGVRLGIDFGAALAIGTALGYDAIALAELLPAGEIGLTNAINEKLQRD